MSTPISKDILTDWILASALQLQLAQALHQTALPHLQIRHCTYSTVVSSHHNARGGLGGWGVWGAGDLHGCTGDVLQ